MRNGTDLITRIVFFFLVITFGLLSGALGNTQNNTTIIDYSLNPDDVEYLVITHPEFLDEILPLAIWRHKEGFPAKVISFIPENPNEVKDLIADHYNGGTLKYVLLVGNKYFMPIAYWGDFPSDYWYSCITLDGAGQPDLYGDVALGRLPVGSATQAENLVSKILKFEKNPPTNLWLNKALFSSYRSEMSFGRYKKDIKDDYMPNINFTVHLALGKNIAGLVSNDDVKNAINKGVQFVNYLGHGIQTCWENWTRGPDGNLQDWDLTNVNSLENGDMTPIVFNICCLTHALDHYPDPASYCLGEAWVNKYPGGAVASVGASRVTTPTLVSIIDKEIFRLICMEGNYRLGSVINEMKFYLANLTQPPLGTNNAVKMFSLFGDPATEIWTENPMTLNVVKPVFLTLDPHIFEVSVTDAGNPVSNAIVCIYKEDEIYAVKTTDSNGQVFFRVNPSTMGTLHVTVSKHDHFPYEGEIQVIQ